MEKKELMALIGNNVRQYRTEKKYTQEQLANQVNINSSAITRIENGQRMMSIPILRAVAESLDVSADSLLFNRTCSTHIENIITLLNGQTESSLTHIEKVIILLIAEYGEVEDKL